MKNYVAIVKKIPYNRKKEVFVLSDFGKNLRVLRKKRGLTQTQLGHILHYGSTAIAGYESGRNEPSLDDLIRLADFFDVSLDALLGREQFLENQGGYGEFCRMDMEERKKLLQILRILS